MKEISEIQVTDFLEEFSSVLWVQLRSDDTRHGDKWRHLPKEGQELRIWNRFADYFEEYRYEEIPIPWLKIAGLAMIAWIRENYPDVMIEEDDK